MHLLMSLDLTVGMCCYQRGGLLQENSALLYPLHAVAVASQCDSIQQRVPCTRLLRQELPASGDQHRQASSSAQSAGGQTASSIIYLKKKIHRTTAASIDELQTKA